MINQAPKKYEPETLEKAIMQYWSETDAYHKTKAHRAEGKDFYFNDGPPYTSGSIHLGTAWNKILKDTVIRYLRMNNYNVRDQAGFDMHGLPIEVRVEKEQQFKRKQDIIDFGIDNFINICKEFALKYKDTMTEQFKALGVWLDWEHPYITITNQYIESAWWTIKRAYDRDLLMRAERVLTWCPRCSTALAEAEVEYWDEEDYSIYVKFPLKDRENEYIVIWTTTPWTLPADIAVTLHPDFTYARAKVKKDDKEEIWLLLEERAQEVAERGGYELVEILETKQGEDLEGTSYVHPLKDEVPYHQEEHGYNFYRVILDTYVTAEMTGCVHTAPGHGPDDFETGKRYDLPAFCPVDESGVFTEEAGKWAGIFTKDADQDILKLLWDKGLMISEDKIVHRYGHCWRCRSSITYRATKQWFLKVTELRDKMLEEISRIRWVPEWAGSSRQYAWVEGTRDWCISRQRYWGIPLPIWLCNDCGELMVVGSVNELKERAEVGYEEGMDLHRPWIDNVKLKCPKCNTLQPRVPDVLDVWLDSAICSWAQLGYPQNKAEFERWWPTDWITEAHDQTRGWFYSQLGASVIAFDKIPYESVLMHGHALDETGRPMSKSRGTSVDLEAIIKQFGVDSLRFYIMRASAPWEDVPFSTDGVKNANRMLNILWNVYSFSTTYMALDKFDAEVTTFESIKNDLKLEDNWLYSRLEGLKKTVTTELDEYNLHKVCRAIEYFILEDLSRWYVRLIRDRTWIESTSPDKLSAYRTLYDALISIAKVLAPLTPFIAEEIYKNLDKALPSVHMEDWLKVNDELIDTTLEAHMQIIQDLSEGVLSGRQKAKLKLRWPCKRIIVNADNDEVVAAVSALEDILMAQTNTKTIEVIPPGEQWGESEIEVQPNLSTLGPIFKTNTGKVAEQIKSLDATELQELFAANKPYMLEFEGEQHELTPELVKLIQKIPEDIIGSDFQGGVVFVDAEITPELKAEGFARELIRRVQDMRKEMDLDVEENIKTLVKLSSELVPLFEKWHDYVRTETRSKELEIGVPVIEGEFTKKWEIEGETLEIGISKV